MWDAIRSMTSSDKTAYRFLEMTEIRSFNWWPVPAIRAATRGRAAAPPGRPGKSCHEENGGQFDKHATHIVVYSTLERFRIVRDANRRSSMVLSMPLGRWRDSTGAPRCGSFPPGPVDKRTPAVYSVHCVAKKPMRPQRVRSRSVGESVPRGRERAPRSAVTTRGGRKA